MGTLAKKCSKCCEHKSLEDFPRNQYGRYGRKSTCKSCAKVYYDANRQTILEQKKEYQSRKKHSIAIYRHKYYQANKKALIQQAVLREKGYKATNPQFKIAKSLRDRIRKALKRNKGIRAGSAIKDLGCSLSELKLYLETQFRDGMSWANYGSEWHIDHIVPLYKLDLTLRSDFLKACHYTNLRPLLSAENLRRPKK